MRAVFLLAALLCAAFAPHQVICQTGYLSLPHNSSSSQNATHTREKKQHRTSVQRTFSFSDTSDYCKSFDPPDRLVVAAVSRHEVSWLEDMGIPFMAYQHRDPFQPLYYVNRANEAGAYLQFMLDFYHCLPKVTAFIHGHQWESWHSADMHMVLPKLRWDNVEFTDINRKQPVWSIPIGNLSRDPPGAVLASGADAYNGSFHPLQTFNGKVYEAEPLRLWLDYHAFARAYDKHFGRYGLGAMPESVSYVCCAQFAVHRDRVYGRPYSFYQATKQYMLDNDLQRNSMFDKAFTVGDVLNLYWTMVFGESADYRLRDECEIFDCGVNGTRLMYQGYGPRIVLWDAWAGGYHPQWEQNLSR